MIFQDSIPGPQVEAAAARLPAMRPVGQADWITVDGAYAGQMAEKARLVAVQPGLVMGGGGAAADEALAEVMALLAARADFTVAGCKVRRPDGAVVVVDAARPLLALTQLLQEDICILEKQGDAHVLTAAALCFPAAWTLAEKLGRSLMGIHAPVAPYDNAIGARVQRLFDGVQVGRPVWRANLFHYDDPALFQPHSEAAPRPVGTADSPYLRSERQTVVRLPQTRAVVFAIHTVIVVA